MPTWAIIITQVIAVYGALLGNMIMQSCMMFPDRLLKLSEFSPKLLPSELAALWTLISGRRSLWEAGIAAPAKTPFDAVGRVSASAGWNSGSA